MFGPHPAFGHPLPLRGRRPAAESWSRGQVAHAPSRTRAKVAFPKAAPTNQLIANRPSPAKRERVAEGRVRAEHSEGSADTPSEETPTNFHFFSSAAMRGAFLCLKSAQFAAITTKQAPFSNEIHISNSSSAVRHFAARLECSRANRAFHDFSRHNISITCRHFGSARGRADHAGTRPGGFSGSGSQTVVSCGRVFVFWLLALAL